jgi:microcin C transport system ATP-binding protein
MDRYPHEFSGGQRQRIAIARRHDPAAQARRARRAHQRARHDGAGADRGASARAPAQVRLAYVFISHDLRVVRALAHKVAVMQNGDVVEAGDARAIFDAPRTEYTRKLMGAAFDLEVEAV